jgi:drug/metabolite transporter (DMT)-like permease
VAMLAMNYLMCTLLSMGFSGHDSLFPTGSTLTLLMGTAQGLLYLVSFLLLNISTARNGVVLSSVFMKLGLLVPMVLSIFLFGELPSVLQLIGFVMALTAIFLINFEPGQKQIRMNWLLLLLLIGGGSGDAMAKIFETWGDPSLASHFLLYTFLTALILCLALMKYKQQRIGRAELLFGLAIGIPNFFSAKFLLAALNSLPAVIVYPTYSVATMLVVTLAGALFFREKLNRNQWLALVIILLALVFLNI